MNGNAPLLSVRQLEFAYGNVSVLFGVDLDLHPGEVLGVLGPNGAGKTTLLRVVCGLERPDAGAIHYAGSAVTGISPADRVRRGLVTVFAGESTFPDLTVMENLRVSGYTLPDEPGLLEERVGEMLGLFPRLAERRAATASQLSGGERQMLALARALLLHPDVLCIDELSLGLAPSLVQRLAASIRDFRDRGGSVLLVEQSPAVVAGIADRIALMERGTVVAVLDDLAELGFEAEVSS